MLHAATTTSDLWLILYAFVLLLFRVCLGTGGERHVIYAWYGE